MVIKLDRDSLDSFQSKLKEVDATWRDDFSLRDAVDESYLLIKRARDKFKVSWEKLAEILSETSKGRPINPDTLRQVYSEVSRSRSGRSRKKKQAPSSSQNTSKSAETEEYRQQGEVEVEVQKTVASTVDSSHPLVEDVSMLPAMPSLGSEDIQMNIDSHQAEEITELLQPDKNSENENKEVDFSSDSAEEFTKPSELIQTVSNNDIQPFTVVEKDEKAADFLENEAATSSLVEETAKEDSKDRFSQRRERVRNKNG